MMYRLAKVGFSQSYTYFTWRNTKQELTEYLTELTTTAPAEFFRPHFFVNTPDINPIFLQSSGRAGLPDPRRAGRDAVGPVGRLFRLRAVRGRAAAGPRGISRLGEVRDPRPGLRTRPATSSREITRAQPHPAGAIPRCTAISACASTMPSNDQVLVYGKALPGHDDMIFVVVSLDPHNVQETSFEIPLWEWKLPDSGALGVEDLMTGSRFTWHGKRQRLRLDPGAARPSRSGACSPRRLAHERDRRPNSPACWPTSRSGTRTRSSTSCT